MAARFRTRREDFPPNLDGLTIQQVVLYLDRGGAAPFPDPLPIGLWLTPLAGSGAPRAVGGTAASVDGLYSTRREATEWRDELIGVPPIGDWELVFPDDPFARGLFGQEQVQDILLVITYGAAMPDWPS